MWGLKVEGPLMAWWRVTRAAVAVCCLLGFVAASWSLLSGCLDCVGAFWEIIWPPLDLVVITDNPKSSFDLHLFYMYTVYANPAG